MLAEFEFYNPSSLSEAVDYLASGSDILKAGGPVLPLAGGTNLVVDMRAGRECPASLIGLNNIAELRFIRVEKQRVTMGSGTTVSDVLRHPELAGIAPSLVEAARLFAGMMVRNTATLAGNICCGSPAADLMPPLLVLDAELLLASKSGQRHLPLSEFYVGFKDNQLQQDELITEISFPIPSSRSCNLFYKLARRKGDAITVTGVAVAVELDDEICSRARIALGAVAPTVMRATSAESFLTGKPFTPELISGAAEQAADESNPIDDLRASAEYRRHSVNVLTRRLLTRVAEAISNGG